MSVLWEASTWLARAACVVVILAAAWALARLLHEALTYDLRDTHDETDRLPRLGRALGHDREDTP